MIIGKRKLKKLKLFIVSQQLEKLTLVSYLILIPLLSFYDQIQLSSQPIDNQIFLKTFNFQAFYDSQNAIQLLNYLENDFLVKYFDFSTFYIPIQEFMILQQRQENYICEDQDYLVCTYKDQYQKSYFQYIPSDPTNCVEINCEEFTQRDNISKKSIQDIDQEQIKIQGKFKSYDQLNYFINIKQGQNISEVFNKIKNNNWIDQQTQVIVCLASYYNLKSKKQVQLVFFSESPFNTENLNLQLNVYSFKIIKFNDSLHGFFFFYFIVVVIFIGFRFLLELAYKFNRYYLLSQIIHFLAIILFIQNRFQRILFSTYRDQTNLIFNETQFNEIIGVPIFGPVKFINMSQTILLEELALLIIWIIYPIKIFTLIFRIFSAQWYRAYFNSLFRTINPYLIVMLFILLFYIGGFSLINLLDTVYREDIRKNAILSIIQGLLIEKNQQFDVIQIINSYSLVFQFVKYIFYLISVIYIYGVLIENFHKATIFVMNIENKYEKEIKQQISDVNVRTLKLLKEVLRILQKDKQKAQKQETFPNNSQILDNEFYSYDNSDKRLEKILVVYEIQNSYLDEIQRYKDKKNQNRSANRRKHQSNLMASSILQKNSQRSIFNKYSTKLDSYIPIIDEQETEDFFQDNAKNIEDKGIKIRYFCVIDQVIQFLLMLIKLRLEYLSPRAEKRIRIFFFINSNEVSQDDVYKMLSYLIVNLKKNHLSFPILIFSHHKDWNIKKEKYVTLKKMYKNIFSTLDQECALLFSYMNTEFFELENNYIKNQRFTENKIIKQKYISYEEEVEDKSEQEDFD